MKLAFCGFDFFAGVVEMICSNESASIVEMYSYEVDGFYNTNSVLQSIASELNVPISFDRIEVEDLKRLQSMGVTALLVGGYPYIIPNIENFSVINIHPSLLPEGKGPWPLPEIIQKRPEVAGVTLHLATAVIDGGPILIQKSVNLDTNDIYEVLCNKCQIAAIECVEDLLQNFNALLNSASEQSAGSYFSMPTEEDEEIHWNRSVGALKLQFRAFGIAELSATLNGRKLLVRRAHAWRSSNPRAPGSVFQSNQNILVVGCLDGFVSIVDYRWERN